MTVFPPAVLGSLTAQGQCVVLNASNRLRLVPSCQRSRMHYSCGGQKVMVYNLISFRPMTSIVDTYIEEYSGRQTKSIIPKEYTVWLSCFSFLDCSYSNIQRLTASPRITACSSPTIAIRSQPRLLTYRIPYTRSSLQYLFTEILLTLLLLI